MMILDYSEKGKCFLTICPYDRIQLFGKITNGKMIRNKFGDIAHNEWIRSSEIRTEIIPLFEPHDP